MAKTADNFLDDFSDGMTAELDARKADPGQCPGYGPDKSCVARAEYFQWIVNDPRAFCREHTLRAAEFWTGLGFPPPPYIRLSDGPTFRVVPAEDR